MLLEIGIAQQLLALVFAVRGCGEMCTDPQRYRSRECLIPGQAPVMHCAPKAMQLHGETLWEMDEHI